MKKFSLVEQDRYINIDGKGVWFTEESWPFPEIEHLWSIQWRDDGTPGGVGQIEYDSADRQNDPCTKECIERYAEAWREEIDRQTAEKEEQENKAEKDALSWAEAMRELESQMEEMQERHAKALTDTVEKDKELHDRLTQQMFEQEERHAESLMELMKDHDSQMETVHKEIERQHEELFYGQDIVENQETRYQNTPEDITLFDGNVDSSLFDDVIDSSHFDLEPSVLEMLDESQVIDEDIEQVMEDKPKKDFDDVDLSILDSEFNLELLFEDSADEQVVADIEELLADDTPTVDEVVGNLVKEVEEDE